MRHVPTWHLLSAIHHNPRSVSVFFFHPLGHFHYPIYTLPCRPLKTTPERSSETQVCHDQTAYAFQSHTVSWAGAMRQCDKSQLNNSTDWFLFCSCTQWYIKHVSIGAAAVFFFKYFCWKLVGLHPFGRQVSLWTGVCVQTVLLFALESLAMFRKECKHTSNCTLPTMYCALPSLF